MANLRLQNPYFEETIKVKEGCKRIEDLLGWYDLGNIQFIKLHQIEPNDRMITISPKHFAKIDYYEDEEND